jgi:hypothetical protein
MRPTCLASVAVLALAVTTASAEDFPNPEFASWSKFKKGTSVTLKTTATAGGVASEVLMTTTLLETGADKLVVETATVTKVNNMEFKASAKRDVMKTIKLPDGVKKDAKDAKVEKPMGTFEEGTETLKIGGTEIKTKWYKSKAEIAGNKTESKTWMSDDVPGGLVKLESTTTGTVASSMKMELTELKKP